jgi:UbiD family decarboxylase
VGSAPSVAGDQLLDGRGRPRPEGDEGEVDDVYREREGHLIEPVTVDGPAPCQELVLTGDQIDLTTLPILRHYEKDAGCGDRAGLPRGVQDRPRFGPST